MKDDIDRRTGRELTRKLADVHPARAEDVERLSRMLNQKMEIFPDPACREWFKLFQHVDDDGTGRISYKELAGMVREELRLGPSELREEELEGLWRALDADSSGWISAGEFGRFMRRGEMTAEHLSPTREDRNRLRERARASLQAEEDHRLNQSARAIDSEASRLEQEALRLERALAKKLPSIPTRHASTTYPQPSAKTTKAGRKTKSRREPQNGNNHNRPTFASRSAGVLAQGGDLDWAN